MSAQSLFLEKTTAWDSVCFPVSTTPLAALLTGPYLVPSDRSQAIVGERAPGQYTIFALQSQDYTLIPNQLVRDVAAEFLPGHRLSASSNSRGEFSLTLVMPEEVKNIVASGKNATITDRVFRSMIINNSYSGKAPFSLQGSAEWEKEQVGQHTKMRVSYFREVCTNGLMGWADDYYTVDEYVQWLAAGKPVAHKRVTQEKPAELVEVTEREVKREQEMLLERKFHHKGLNLVAFRKHLAEAFRLFLQQKHSLTTQIYGQLSSQPVPLNREKLFADTKLPRMLARTALERLAFEETLLQTPATLWLAYNAANFALFNSKSSLGINERFRHDEQLFHHFAELAMR